MDENKELDESEELVIDDLVEVPELRPELETIAVFVSVEEERELVILSGVVDVSAILEENEESVGLEEGADVTVEKKGNFDVEYENGDSKAVVLVVEGTEVTAEGNGDERCEDCLDALDRVEVDEYLTELELTPTLQLTS